MSINKPVSEWTIDVTPTPQRRLEYQRLRSALILTLQPMLLEEGFDLRDPSEPLIPFLDAQMYVLATIIADLKAKKEQPPCT